MDNAMPAKIWIVVEEKYHTVDCTYVSGLSSSGTRYPQMRITATAITNIVIIETAIQKRTLFHFGVGGSAGGSAISSAFSPLRRPRARKRRVLCRPPLPFRPRLQISNCPARGTARKSPECSSPLGRASPFPTCKSSDGSHAGVPPTSPASFHSACAILQFCCQFPLLGSYPISSTTCLLRLYHILPAFSIAFLKKSNPR